MRVPAVHWRVPAVHWRIRAVHWRIPAGHCRALLGRWRVLAGHWCVPAVHWRVPAVPKGPKTGHCGIVKGPDVPKPNRFCSELSVREHRALACQDCPAAAGNPCSGVPSRKALLHVKTAQPRLETQLGGASRGFWGAILLKFHWFYMQNCQVERWFDLGHQGSRRFKTNAIFAHQALRPTPTHTHSRPLHRLNKNQRKPSRGEDFCSERPLSLGYIDSCEASAL